MFFPYNRQSTYKPITILLIFFTNNCYRSLHMNITWTYNWLQSIFESINRWITALGNLARNATFSMNGWCTMIEYLLYKCCLTFASICSSTTNWISAHLRWKVHGKNFPKASSLSNKKKEEHRWKFIEIMGNTTSMRVPSPLHLRSMLPTTQNRWIWGNASERGERD